MALAIPVLFLYQFTTTVGASLDSWFQNQRATPVDMKNKTLGQAQIQITKDWQQELPALGIQGPRHLLRRVGPLLVGVSLERYSPNEYEPTFHVHFLGNVERGFFLTMETGVAPGLRSPEEVIEVSAHKERYKDVARRLVEQAPLSLQGPLTVKEVVEAYRKYSKTRGTSQVSNLYGDCIKLLSCYGYAAEAEEMLNEILEMPLRDGNFKWFGSRQAFEEQMREAIAHPDTVWETVKQQIEQHKVGKLPYEEFVGAVPVGRT